MTDLFTEYGNLPANWDGSDALPITPGVLLAASMVLLRVRHAAHVARVPWEEPSCAPCPDGEFDLSWDIGGRWALLCVAESEDTLTLVTQVEGYEPVLERVTGERAILAALWALRGHSTEEEA